MTATAQIPIYSRGSIVAYATVDAEDYERVNALRWHLNKNGYAQRGGLYMARFVRDLQPGDPRAIHHINEYKLDNRRANLMVCANHVEGMRQPHPNARANHRTHAVARLRLYTFDELRAMSRPATEAAA